MIIKIVMFCLCLCFVSLFIKKKKKKSGQVRKIMPPPPKKKTGISGHILHKIGIFSNYFWMYFKIDLKHSMYIFIKISIFMFLVSFTV